MDANDWVAQQEMHLTAWHEAGHAVVAWALGGTVQCVWVADRATFEAHTGDCGGCYTSPIESKDEFASIEARVVTFLAGSIAGEGEGDDNANVLEDESYDATKARDLLVEYASAEDSMLLWWEVDGWVDDQLCELFSRAAALVSKHWADIGRVARVLKKKRFLNEKEFLALMRSSAWQPPPRPAPDPNLIDPMEPM